MNENASADNIDKFRALNGGWRTTFRGDLAGGITAALIPLPKAMALGALVLSPLGPEYISTGIAAGLISLVTANVTAAILGDMPIMNNSPFSLSSFMLLAALGNIVAAAGGHVDGQAQAFTMVAFLCLTVLMSGGFQCVFGLLRLGDLAKYIPYPVLAGLLNGSAFLIILSQVKTILGLPKDTILLNAVFHPGEIHLLTLIVGLTACVSIWFGPRISKKIPSPVYGIAGGCLVYYLLALLGFRAQMGAVIGPIPSVIPTPRFGGELVDIVTDPDQWSYVASLVPLAVGIAAINSLRSLVVCSAGDSLTMKRTDANRELIGQGFSNIVNGIFGGISTAGSMSSTLSNFQSGGRTAFSRAVSGIFPLLVFLLLSPLIAGIPNAVLAGLLIMIAVGSFDKWSVSLLFQLRSAWVARDRRIFVNVAIVALVTLLTLLFGILEALAAGFVISVGVFVVRMGKSGIRREFTADAFHSNTQYREAEFALLEKEGGRIRVLELEGAMFFGTSDKIAAHVEKCLDGDTEFIILDLKRISELDSTGARIIKQLGKKCRTRHVRLCLSGVDPGEPGIYGELANFCTYGELCDICYPDLEYALSSAENALLNSLVSADRYRTELTLDALDAFELFTPGDIDAVSAYLDRQVCAGSDKFFSQGDPGNGVFFIAKGRAEVYQNRWDGTRQRIGTLCPGTAIGEMALIDQRHRSADIVAETDLVCYHLSLDSMELLSVEKPDLSYKLIRGIARELSTRLRISNRIQASLKE